MAAPQLKTFITCAITGKPDAAGSVALSADHAAADRRQCAGGGGGGRCDRAYPCARSRDRPCPRCRSIFTATWWIASAPRNQGPDHQSDDGPGRALRAVREDPKVAGPGTTLLPPEKRVEHVELLKPEICTLDLNTMNSGGQVVINTPRNVRKMAEGMRAAGVMPELELFDSGDIHLARDLIADGMLQGPRLVHARARRQIRLQRVAGNHALRAQPVAAGRDLGRLRHRPHRVPDGGAGLAARRPCPRRHGRQSLYVEGRAGEDQRRARGARGAIIHSLGADIAIRGSAGDAAGCFRALRRAAYKSCRVNLPCGTAGRWVPSSPASRRPSAPSPRRRPRDRRWLRRR